VNRSQDILDYLALESTPATVVLAPNAPPVAHARGELRVIQSYVLSASDVLDILMVFKGQASNPDLGSSGTFSFGRREIGRIRVNYLTQRGSKIVSVERIPFDIPSLDALCEDRAAVEVLLDAARREQGGVVAVSGPDRAANGTLVYALLERLNQSMRRLIAIVENPLTYLMVHRNSIVIQCDVGTDAPTIGQGVRGVLMLQPQLLYVGGVQSPEDALSLRHALHEGRLIVVSSAMLDAAAMSELLPAAGVGGDGARLLVHVSRGNDRRLALRVE
jgi:twitching motility protein PilT